MSDKPTPRTDAAFALDGTMKIRLERMRDLCAEFEESLHFVGRALTAPQARVKELERPGYQWARKEPTEKMRIAGQMAIPALPYYEEYKRRTGNQDQPWAYAVACYKAMLAADGDEG